MKKCVVIIVVRLILIMLRQGNTCGMNKNDIVKNEDDYGLERQQWNDREAENMAMVDENKEETGKQENKTSGVDPEV